MTSSMTKGMTSPQKRNNSGKGNAKNNESDSGENEAILRIEQVLNAKIEGLNSKIEVLTNLLNSKDSEIATLNQQVGSLNA